MAHSVIQAFSNHRMLTMAPNLLGAGGLLYKKGFYTNNILKCNRVIILDTVLLPFKMQIFLHSSMLI